FKAEDAELFRRGVSVAGYEPLPNKQATAAAAVAVTKPSGSGSSASTVLRGSGGHISAVVGSTNSALTSALPSVELASDTSPSLPKTTAAMPASTRGSSRASLASRVGD
ncbi:hypothetical protein HK405_010415, partial [Cladochytrium tenue]